MATAKIDVTLETKILAELDQLVVRQVFPNRRKAIQEAVQDKLARMRYDQLARECAKLDPREEKALAEEGMVIQERSQGIEHATLPVPYLFEE